MEQVLKQEAEDIGYEGKEILDYVKEQQKWDREEREQSGEKSGWQNCKQKKKKRVDELQAEDKKRAEICIVHIQAAKDQAKIEADKELDLKNLD